MIRVISKMDLGVREMGFTFCGTHPLMTRIQASRAILFFIFEYPLLFVNTKIKEVSMTGNATNTRCCTTHGTVSKSQRTLTVTKIRKTIKMKQPTLFPFKVNARKDSKNA